MKVDLWFEDVHGYRGDVRGVSAFSAGERRYLNRNGQSTGGPLWGTPWNANNPTNTERF